MPSALRSALYSATVSLGLSCTTPSNAAPRTVADLPFARVGDSQLALDLHLPGGEAKPVGLLVWVHGGAWRAGDRKSAGLEGLTAKGWAVASVDYRLSPVARFPAQVHDIKAAIRFLRAQASHYGFPASRLVIAGSSAGGHLAALVGVSNGHPDLEGTVGNQPEVSSDVQGIVDLYGASNLTTILSQSTPHGLSVRVPALELLLGGQPSQVSALAQLASPVFHVDEKDPPLLLLHGDQDHQMPINQAHELDGKYRDLGLTSRLVVLHGAGHGGPEFTNAAQLDLIARFLERHVPRPVRSEP